MGVYRLKPTIQHYQWGHKEMLPTFLGTAPTGEPWAELWLGTHPGGASLVVTDTGSSVELSEFLKDHGYSHNLPYLFKILAIASPLSLQVHPAKEWAAKRYKEENLQEVPLSAPHRLYKDENHKPEIILAVTPLTAMCGFRKEDEIRRNLAPIFSGPRGAGNTTNIANAQGAFPKVSGEINFFQDTLCTLMEATQEEKATLIAWALTHHANTQEGKLIALLSERYPGDVGALAPLFLQLINLEPGEALFQGAREIHAYVSGMGIELMANSDNVIRAGLTPKHVDLPELLRVVDFSYTKKDVVPLQQHAERSSFPIDGIDDFLLATIEVNGSKRITKIHGAEIWLLGDKMSLRQGSKQFELNRGEALLVLEDSEPIELLGSGRVYVATTPSTTPR